MQLKMHVDAKRVLADSIIDLAKQRSLDKITIQNIVDNCQAVRRTFYNHFTDKYDLINWIFKTNFNDIVEQYSDIELVDKVIGRILSFMKDNEGFYSNALCIEGQNCFLDFFSQCAYNFYAGLIERRFGKDALSDDVVFIIKYNCYGQVNIASEWLNKKMADSPETIAQKMVSNMSQDLKKLLNV
ncbi:TetR/AcrR family transcriptional regulator C-terminal domain-containing protein [Desulfosporosinus fructosivorans]